MKSELSTLINEYYEWLRSQTHLIEDDKTNWIAISTPFSGIYNDGIEIYCKKNQDKWILSDGGDTINLLDEAGVNISGSPKRKEIIDGIISNFGVTFNKSEFTIEATKENFSQKKHFLLQALMEIHDLEYLSEKSVKTLFKEDVEEYLKSKKILYTRDVKFTGYNGLDYPFDFQLPKFDKDIVLKSTGVLTNSTIANFVFSWQNVKKNREKHNNSKKFDAAIIINDIAKEPKADLVEALDIEGVKTLFWSKKEELDLLVTNN